MGCESRETRGKVKKLIYIIINEFNLIFEIPCSSIKSAEFCNFTLIFLTIHTFRGHKTS